MSLGKGITFIGLFNFEWHSQNEVGNIDILVFWRDGGKLDLNTGRIQFKVLTILSITLSSFLLEFKGF